MMPSRSSRSLFRLSPGEWWALGLIATAAVLYGLYFRPGASDAESTVARRQVEMAALRADNAQMREFLEASAAGIPSISEDMPTVPELTGLARRQVLRDVAEIMNAVGIRSQTPTASLRGRNGAESPAFELNSEGKLPPRFGELFGLDAAAVARLQDRLDGITGNLNSAILANTSVEQVSMDVTVLHVASLGTQSEVYRQEMLDAFRESLGDDGLRALQLLNREPEATGDWLVKEREAMAAGEPFPPRGQISTLFRSYGAYDRTVTITRNNGGYTFLEAGENLRASGTIADRSTLIDRLGAAAVRLPENF